MVARCRFHLFANGRKVLTTVVSARRDWIENADELKTGDRRGGCPGYPKHLRGVAMGQEPGQQAEPKETHREEELGLERLAGALGGYHILAQFILMIFSSR